ncbi:MAG: hypothetical protein UU23_C0003G0020 [Candidatus Curtissbacteria bacterium GW2011_GWA1_40_9]|uniref:Uncharacterized protein n=1 Tax=Candidatus Curtissbacteria bacterium GW2011_GWA1_40_9 TaxID=1618408 RepID=A0A0G0WRY5_9BACT|nr:MAG: hypothetical protein UU23_C0003G0020 [Candidatus Curtissbacteria bacterium GW2011_GWA1_40_9]
MPTTERPIPTQTPLSRRAEVSRNLSRLAEVSNIHNVSKWWNQHIGTKFEEDIDSWIVHRFTVIDAKSNWANDATTLVDESQDEDAILKAFRVARGRHLVSRLVMQKLVHEAKKYVRRKKISEDIAMDYVRDRATADGGIFDILGVTSKRKQEQLLELAA